MKRVASIPRKPFQFKLDLHTGVPVYRQIMDQVRGGLAAGVGAVGRVQQLASHARADLVGLLLELAAHLLEPRRDCRIGAFPRHPVAPLRLHLQIGDVHAFLGRE